MSQWPVVDRVPVVLPTLPGHDDLLWATLIELTILPLAARHLSHEEWAALGDASVADITRSQLPLMFGMVLEEATPDERSEMLGTVPLPIRLLLRTWGARHYARYVRTVRQG